MTERREHAAISRLLAVVVAWAASFWALSRYGVDLLPRAFARELSLEAYLVLVQLATLGIGLGLSFALLGDPREVLPLEVKSGRKLLVVTALVPAVFAASTMIAFFVARPTLIAELEAGGREAVQKNTGQYGRELAAAPALLTVFWGAVVSPVCEELFFRGALWTLVHRLVRNGIVTSILVGVCFGLLHWDMPGGLGIVRLVSALGLGVACGVARHATGTIAAPAVLHVLYNLLPIATVRRWIVSETFPTRYATPTATVLLGAIGVAAVLVSYAVKRALGKQEDPR